MAIVAHPPDFVGASRAAWQDVLRTAVRDAATLCRVLRLPPEWAARAAAAADSFPVFAPLTYLSRVRPGDPHDPLLRQVLPLAAEDQAFDPWTADPVGDAAAVAAPGLLQKYAGRALLITTGACAIHCRYCFRRHFPYHAQGGAAEQWDAALATLRGDDTLTEVLLSGGDPLTLPDEALARLSRRLDAIPHLRRLRLHTRLPIVIPQRVDDQLLQWLTASRLTPWLVIHANHPAELDEHVAAALRRLSEAGVPLLNQTVLLRGVNDDAQVLGELSERLVDLKVAPYYLHQLDRVAGAVHFDTPPALGPALIDALRRQLPGYAVPRLVREEAGRPSKTVVA